MNGFTVYRLFDLDASGQTSRGRGRESTNILLINDCLPACITKIYRADDTVR